MNGNNKLAVCDAQMIEIAQMWINSQFKDKPKVVGVDRSGGVAGTFLIRLSSKVAEASGE